MNAPTLLEDRLRHGLQAAAAALPPAEEVRARPRPAAHPGPFRPRWMVAALGSAAAAAVVAGAVVVAGDGDGQPDVRSDPVGTPGTGGQTTEPAPDGPPDLEVTGPANGQVPGQAVVVGDELRTYGPDGAQTGAMSLAPLEQVQAASSDLAGGWVACGMSGPAGGQLVWFPQGGEPTPLEGTSVTCMADAVKVIDAPEGPTAVYLGVGPGGSIGSHYAAVVLATGEIRQLTLPVDPMGFYSWAATTGKAAFYSDATGFQLFDLATGEALPAAAIDPGGPVDDLVLSPDGATVALLTGDIVSPATDLVVYDVATGAELHREAFAMSLEGAELSYDGTTVAVGNYYDAGDVPYPPVTVIDLSTQARHTIDAHGLVL